MRVFLATIGLALVAGVALAREAGWRTYANPRFGVIVDYPSVFTLTDPPPDNGDGQGFRTARGDSRLAVFGSYNIDNASAEQLMQTYREPDIAYSYATSAKGWFVLSGTRHDTISYLRCNFGRSDIVGCVRLEYPSSNAAQWSATADRISKSLRVAPVHRN